MTRDARTIVLADFIRNQKGAILARWEARARTASVARDQARATLIDSLPELLERIGENADAFVDGTAAAAPASVSERHANERLEQGYALGDVVEEYVQLRACIFERLEETGLTIAPHESRHLNLAIDRALRETTRRYVAANERMLRALDRISSEPTARRSLEGVLTDILATLKDSAGAEIDSVAILLLGDDGRLHMRATIGLEEELEDDHSLAVGEGFAGRIAQSAEPLLSKNAAEDPRVVSPAIRRRGTRALYGVPMLDEGEVIGVAHIGSTQATELSDGDMMLFRAMVNRAATVIVRAQFVDALQRTAHFREQFIGVLGHDLRSPLHNIVMSTELLLSSPEAAPDRVRTLHERILRSAHRMERLIAEILDFARARLGGTFGVKATELSLDDVVRDVVDEVRPRAGRRTIVVDGATGITGAWDRERLAQVLANLLGNAVQHSPDDTTVRLTLAQTERNARIEVWNGGEPIAPALRTSLFEPFAKRLGSEGLGLGLFIAHEIVHAHGGTIGVRSDESGTTFAVELPLAQGGASPRSSSDAGSGGGGSGGVPGGASARSSSDAGSTSPASS